MSSAINWINHVSYDLLDECSDDDNLIIFLTQAGHTAISPRTTGTKGWDDADHLEYAATHGYVLLTQNSPGFRRLHRDWQAQGQTHSGIFLVYQDNNVRKDMRPLPTSSELSEICWFPVCPLLMKSTFSTNGNSNPGCYTVNGHKLPFR
jgi:hypothetical protein